MVNPYLMKYLLCIISFFVISFTFSQEICDNGIDDDGDGLIDLNDQTDCSCTVVSNVVSSLIPNPSFETTNCCPTFLGEMNCATDWLQATQPSTDYYNCGYNSGAAVSAGLQMPPDGTGYVGTLFIDGWQEYVGACLNSPLLAGENYSLQLDLAVVAADPSLNSCNGGVVNYLPIDITIFGNTGCPTMPLPNEYGCPGAGWNVIGSINYTPTANWGQITIDFTPSVDINSVMIGSPCVLPAGYDWGNGWNNCGPYFLFDNLILQQSALFNGSGNLTQNGSWCNNNLDIAGINTPGNTYQWYLDGVAIIGETSSTIQLSANNYLAGEYTLRIDDGTSCIVETLIIDPEVIPVASFSSTPSCINSPSSFNNTSNITDGTITNWDWDFGDGNISVSENPDNTFTSTGPYNVSLTVTSDQGCTNTIVQPFNSLVSPVANFNFSLNGSIISEACLGDNINFDDISTISNPNTVSNWSWDFGDGSTSLIQNPTHSYATAGTYNVSLTAISNEGCDSTIVHSIVIHELPIADFSSDVVCFGNATSLTDLTVYPISQITEWQWDVLNNNSVDYNTQNPQHNFVAWGTYDVSLLVVAQNGCTSIPVVNQVVINDLPNAEFQFDEVCIGFQTTLNDQSSVNNSNIINWNWNFDDGNSSNNQNPNNTYLNSGIYNVELEVESDQGCIGSVVHPIIVFELPQAAFNATTTCINDGPTMFTDVSTDNNGVVVQSNWIFSNGNIANGTEVNNQFNLVSNTIPNTINTAELTVTSNHGCINTITQGVVVYEKPTAYFISDKIQICSDHEINFSDSSYSNTATINSWSWNFYNGTQSSSITPTVYYTTNEAVEHFNVELIVINSYGCYDTTFVSNYIEVLQNPIANFHPMPATVTTLHSETEFINTSEYSSEYDWDFGDGIGISNASNPFYEYAGIQRNYVVELIAYSENRLCSDTAYSTVIVEDVIIFYIPNAFTPDDDEYNQIWKPIFSSGVDPYNFHLLVFNRYGEIVWESYDYTKGWNGFYGGQLVQDGVYVWKLDFKETMSDKKHNHTGHVTILR